MRRIIAVEGLDTDDGRRIARGGLTWTGDPIPLMVQDDSDIHFGTLIGAVLHVARWTGPDYNLIVADYPEEPDDRKPAIEIVTSPGWTPGQPQRGTIKAVTLTTNPSWPHLVGKEHP